MIFVKYPHPDLLQDAQYLDWCKRAAAGEQPDWRELFDWLAKHTRVTWVADLGEDAGQPKCWYSEAPIIGVHVKDVEHYRPKREATPLTKSQRKRLEALGVAVPEELTDLQGYDWLEFDPANYRLSHPAVNRTGGKGSVFPILKATKRLRKDSNAVEYCFLLDPSNPNDAGLLTVGSDGQIFPSLIATAIQDDLPTDELWATDGIKHARAWVSIVVYRLDDQEFVRARREAYNDAVAHVVALEGAISARNRDWIKRETEQLAKKLRCLSPWALTSRSAVRDQIALAEQHASKSDLTKILVAMLAMIEQKEK